MKQKNLRIGTVVVLVIISVGLLTGCVRQTPIIPTNNDIIDIEDLSSVVLGNNKFALDLYSLYKSESGNVFFSPYSISSALAMTYEGAKGQTASEIQSVFYFPEEDEMRNGYANLFKEINKKDKKYKFNTANALWAENDFQFLDEYFNVVEQYYNGKVTNLDFKQEAEASRKTINNWVERQTNDKIKDLIPEGLINKLTRLVLTNAIYFKGDWVKQFDNEKTQDQNFKITKDNVLKVPIMKRTDDKAIFNYTEDDNTQVLEMSYLGKELSMLVFLPKDNNLSFLEDSFSIEQLQKWKKDLKEQRVNVYFPKFKFETKYFMKDDLKEMGMPSAFSGAADFSGITGKKDLNIDEVIHQAFVEVNEEGTEAAAATAVIMKEMATAVGGPKIPVFRADHPFIFIIQQNSTGNILFMGKVVDPR